jgi:hypothetical protein
MFDNGAQLAQPLKLAQRFAQGGHGCGDAAISPLGLHSFEDLYCLSRFLVMY